MKDIQYQCSCMHEISPNELSALVRLYQPVFAFPALSLYLTLYDCGLRNERLSHQDLCSRIHVDKDELVLLRQELERFKLVSTYETSMGYMIDVHVPLTVLGFISHPLYGRLYALVCGQSAFKDVSIECENKRHSLRGEDVSLAFDTTRLDLWDPNLEARHDALDIKPEPPMFNAKRFFSRLAADVFPLEYRSDELVGVVKEFGSKYRISESEMKAYLIEAVKHAKGRFNTISFIQLVDSKYGTLQHPIPKDVQNPYELNAVEFLQYKQDHDYVVNADLNLIESLRQNFSFPDVVINVLIEYVLEINAFRLDKAYVEKVASTWKRKKVATLEDALKQIAQPVSKPKKSVEKPMPTFSKDDSIDEDVDALRKKLKEAFGKGESS